MLYDTVRVTSATIDGLRAREVEVEICIRPGLFRPVVIVGLPDVAVNECKDRVTVAVKASGFDWPSGYRVVINLAPADIRKHGPLYELPIALGILAACGQIPDGALRGTAVVGELALDGRARPVGGVLSMALEVKRLGLRRFILPRGNAIEAAAVPGIEVLPVESLQQAVRFLQGQASLPAVPAPSDDREDAEETDFQDVRGQEAAKRAALVAAAGGHNLLLMGSPGAGKSMIARRLKGILPPLTLEERLEVSQIYSVAGLLGAGLVCRRPFRAPHHTVSEAALTGGGSFPGPGEVSLAHRGVLFLDELPEFPGRVLDALRQPLEDGEVTICRVNGKATFPARFTLVAAANPCPCGYYGCRERPCTCAPGRVERYLGRLSGPLLDRIDLHVDVQPVPFDTLHQPPNGEPTSRMAEAVLEARGRQGKRLEGTGRCTNAEIRTSEMDSLCPLTPAARRLLGEVSRAGAY